MNDSKTCTGCGELKPFSDFNLHKMCAGGRNSRCKLCEKAYKAAYWAAVKEKENPKRLANYYENREEILAKRRVKNKPVPFTAEQKRIRQLESNKRWAKNNVEKSNAYKRKWEQANKEVAQQAKDNWKKNNPEKSLAYTQRRLALKRTNTSAPLTPENRHIRLWMYGPNCTYCGKVCRTDVPRNHPDKATEEHLIPLSRGGPDCGSNLRLSCHACNLTKRTMTYMEFVYGIPRKGGS